ncbi:DNA polymerase IV [Planctomycetales bacterium ZRK34]|nr:DNA polymerase IV [Planctomycetales bacterium ZRK34]
MSEPRVILHVDMDAFFASIEQLDDPSLRGRPVLVGYDGPRGVVAAASYEARPFGCHSAQPMSIAKRMCPQAVIVPGRGSRYREVSKRLFEIFDRFSPLVQPLSVDEAFLDATGTQRLFGPPEELAATLKQIIRDELELTASVGVAPNKFLAKLASDMDKPDGLTVIEPERVLEVLDKLPIGRMWGIGKVTESKLIQRGVNTIGDLRRMPPEWMKDRFGADAERYANLCRGIDDRPVMPDSQAKSISHEHTFDTDIPDPDAVRRVLLDQVEQVARRVRRHEFKAKSVTLKIRFGDFQTITRSQSLDHPTDSTDELWAAARAIFDRWASASFSPVRLIGMAAGSLTQGEGQLDLFGNDESDRRRAVDAATDAITTRFGKRAIRRGGTLD